VALLTLDGGVCSPFPRESAGFLDVFGFQWMGKFLVLFKVHHPTPFLLRKLLAGESASKVFAEFSAV